MSGGYREGAGRPAGTGKYKEKTIPIRIPVGLLPVVNKLLEKYSFKKEKRSKISRDFVKEVLKEAVW